MNREFIYVPIGACSISQSPDILYCKGLGSCIALCIYSNIKRVGILAHILLPEGDDLSRPYFYANLAVKFMLEELNKRGISKTHIWAKIAGGANMFSNGESHINIGTRNSLAILNYLSVYNIKILNTDLGGRAGRNVEFDLRDGTVRIFTYEKGEYYI